MSELLKKIRSRGHWRVVIRPATFDKKTIASLPALIPILEKTAVNRKGWGFPHVEGFTKIVEGADWVGQEIDWEPIVELWRFYQSGQFVHYSGMMTDWSEHTGTFSGCRSQWDSGGNRMVLLDIKEVMLRLTEVFEFASRLTFTDAGDEQMHLEVTIGGIENYLLRVSATSPADFPRRMVNPAPRIPFEFELHKFELGRVFKL